MSHNACVRRPTIFRDTDPDWYASKRNHTYWCSLEPDQQAQCQFCKPATTGECVHNTSPQGQYGDWCWNVEAWKACEQQEDAAK